MWKVEGHERLADSGRDHVILYTSKFLVEHFVKHSYPNRNLRVASHQNLRGLRMVSALYFWLALPSCAPNELGTGNTKTKTDIIGTTVFIVFTFANWQILLSSFVFPILLHNLWNSSKYSLVWYMSRTISTEQSSRETPNLNSSSAHDPSKHHPRTGRS